MDNLDFAAALGRVPSGLFVITAGREADTTGMLASWVQQCSFDPPQLTIAVQPGRPIGQLLADGAHFVLNLLGEGQGHLLKHFAKGFERDEPAFTGLQLDRSAEGVPVLHVALGHLACIVAGRLSAGDHDLIIARVTGGRLHRDGKPAVHVRKSGLNY